MPRTALCILKFKMNFGRVHSGWFCAQSSSLCPSAPETVMCTSWKEPDERQISLWHDSACPHTAYLTLGKIDKSGFKFSRILPAVRTWPLHTNQLLGSLKHHERASTTKIMWQPSKPCIHSCKMLRVLTHSGIWSKCSAGRNVEITVRISWDSDRTSPVTQEPLL